MLLDDETSREVLARRLLWWIGAAIALGGVVWVAVAY